MRLLVIGGTQFVGRHIVEAALARGHDVTLFHRGATNPGLFPSAEEIHGDRDGDLENLGDGPWDAAIDSCGYVPRIVSASAAYLKDKVDRYAFISSISVFADLSQPGLDEDSPVGTIDDPTGEEVDENNYGPLKALCEDAVRKAFPDAHTIVRPGLVTGPHDHTDRFTYWPHRIARGGDVLAPSLDRGVQYIDARDLGDFVVTAIESDRGGTFNAVTEPGTITMGDLLQTCRDVAHSNANFIVADDAVLLEAGVEPWMGLPLWVPPDDEEFGSLMTVRSDRAIAAGLNFRSLAETVRDTLEWDRGRGETEFKAGLSAEKEAEVLASLR